MIRIYKLRNIKNGQYFKGSVWNPKSWSFSNKIPKTWNSLRYAREALGAMRQRFDETKEDERPEVNPHDLEIIEYEIREINSYKE